MKKIIISITILIILLIGFNGCLESSENQDIDEEKIIGSWVNTSQYVNGSTSFTYVFSSDKTFDMIIILGNDTFGNSGTWNIKDNKLNFNIEGNLIDSDYKFSNDYRKLTISDSPENTMDFIKQ